MISSIATSSIVLAAIYLQVALGWIVIFRATQVLNFATGQFLLLGALVFASFTTSFGWPIVLALVAACVVNAFVAAGSYQFLMRPLAGRPVFSQVIITLGLSIVMMSVIEILWGQHPRNLPSAVPEKVFRLPGDGVLSLLDLVIIGLSIAAYVVLLLFLQYSKPGRQMRAAAESPLLASQSGININRVYTLSWVIAGIALAIGGVGYGYLTLVSPNIADLGLAGIAPALIGGLDDVRGAIVGAIGLALLENLAVTYIGGDMREVAPYLAILLVLAIRPYGLFGSPEVRRV